MEAGTLAEYYGYQWWMDSDGNYMALGYAGQYLIVSPEHNLVTVFASGLPERDFHLPYRLFRTYVLPAVETGDVARGGPGSLATAIRRFESSSDALAVEPVGEADTPLDVPRRVRYELAPNRSGMSAIEFDFDKRLVIEYYGEVAEPHRVGSNQGYELNETGYGYVAVRGGWTADGKYEIEYVGVGEAWRTRFSVSFDGADIGIDVTGTGSPARYTGTRTAPHPEPRGTP
jgi:hypothetical protein